MAGRLPLSPFAAIGLVLRMQEDDEGGRQAAQQLQAAMQAIRDSEPVQLPPEDLVLLWKKAMEDPKSLTDDEHLRVLERWPFDDFNKDCRLRCGNDLEELLNKAIEHPEDISGIEARIIVSGAKYGTDPEGQAPSLLRERWPAELKAQRQQAQDAVQTERERIALQNASQANRRANEQQREARARLTNDDRKNIAWCNRANWVQKLDENFDRQWGFALYRTGFDDDDAWKTFKEQFEDATRTALLATRDTDFIRQRWTIQWIEIRELEGASLVQLCEYDFRRRLTDAASEEEKIRPHLRRDAFLFADSAAIQSATLNHPLPKRGYVNAADATHTSSSLERYHHGFQGSLKVSLTNVLTTFYARLDPTSDPEVKNRMKQTLDVMYYKIQHNREDGTYPPYSIANRGT